LADAGGLRESGTGDKYGLALVKCEGGGVGRWGDGGPVGDFELADGVRFEGGGAEVGEGERGGESDRGVGDRGGGVVRDIEKAWEARAGGGGGAELGAEVDFGGGEAEGGGLGVAGEEDGAGADGPVGLGEAVVGRGGRGGEAEGDVAGGSGGDRFGVDGGEGAVAGGFGEGVWSELVAAWL